MLKYIRDKATGVMESVKLISTANKEVNVKDPEDAEAIIKANTKEKSVKLK